MISGQRAIIIPYYKGDQCIDTCLASVESCISDRTKVFIVNNDQIQLKNRWDKNKVSIINIKRPVGFARAVNTGLFIASTQGYSEFIILNQDAQFIENGCVSLFNALKIDDSVIYSPLVLSKNGVDIHPSFKEFIRASKNKSKEDSAIDFLPGTCWAFSKSQLDKIGLFDPLFYHYGEDRDITSRMQLRFQIAQSSRLVHNNVMDNARYKGDAELLLSVARVRYLVRYSNFKDIFSYLLKRSWLLLRVFKRPLLNLSFITRSVQVLFVEKPDLVNKDYDVIQKRALHYIHKDLNSTS